jgi:ribosomal protein S18 acetylase RimI-like enzyme
VLEPFWGSGIALELHTAAIAEMRRRGIGTARLYTPADQARALRFYEREGWKLHYGPYFEAVIGFDLVEYRLNPGH